jgi:hypothetical protein
MTTHRAPVPTREDPAASYTARHCNGLHMDAAGHIRWSHAHPGDFLAAMGLDQIDPHAEILRWL